MKISHIGYCVECIDSSVNTFKMLGYSQKSDIFYDKSKDCYICFLENSDICVKLIEPASSDSVINHLLNGHGKQDYHLCYETTAFEQDVLNLCEKGFEVFPKEHGGHYLQENAVFLSNEKVGFIEVHNAS